MKLVLIPCILSLCLLENSYIHIVLHNCFGVLCVIFILRVKMPDWRCASIRSGLQLWWCWGYYSAVFLPSWRQRSCTAWQPLGSHPRSLLHSGSHWSIPRLIFIQVVELIIFFFFSILIFRFLSFTFFPKSFPHFKISFSSFGAHNQLAI